jgi:hypothetical protein
MKIFAGILAAVVLVAGLFYFVDVDMTKEARLPDVDVNVSGGQLPEVDVKTGSIELKKEDVTVAVPDVDVKMEDKTISVPTIEVKPASE